MRTRLTDTELDDWIIKHGPLPVFGGIPFSAESCSPSFCTLAPEVRSPFESYGVFAAWLDQCDRELREKEVLLEQKLRSPSFPRLYFVPGSGLQETPF